MLKPDWTIPGTRALAIRWGLFALALVTLGLGLGLPGCGGEGGSGSQEAALNKEPLIKPLPDIQMPSPDELQRIVNKLNTGYRLVRGGEPEKALNYFTQLRELYPDAAMPYLHYAVGLAVSGDPEAALASLEQGYALGFCNHQLVVNDPNMDAVEALPGWPDLERRMKARAAEQHPSNLVSYQHFDPAKEPSFDSFEHLKQHYDSVATHASRLAMLHPMNQIDLYRWDALNHKLAGLEKYRGSAHSDSVADKEEHKLIEQELLRTANNYENSSQTPWLRTTVDLINERADAFIQYFGSDKETGSEAAYMRNRAQWYGLKPLEDADLTDELVQKGIEMQSKTHQEFPGTTGALFGLNDALTLAGTYYGLGSEASAPLLETIQTHYADNAYMRRMQYALQAHVLAHEGIPEFSVTDLDGKDWNSRNTGGRVMLIDFWATWCSPCRKEIPTLVSLYDQYHDQGFDIVGISLDKPQNKTDEDLRTFADENGMTWPIVYDKQEWRSPAVQACKVTGIPFPILLNREGKVIAAGEWATGEKLKEAVEKLFPAS